MNDVNDLVVNLFDESNFRLVVVSLGLFLLAQIIRIFIFKKIDKNKNINVYDKVQFKTNIKAYLNLFLFLLLATLWFAQLQSIIVSLLAIAAALVLATKELIMSFMGGIQIRINSYFKVGDRIEVDGVRGFVVEKTMTSTKVLEVGPERNSQQTTGDMITLPNSIMLSKPVKNESYFKDYSIKSFSLKVPTGAKFEKFESLVLQWGWDVSQSYIEEAKKIIGNFCQKEGLHIPTIDPRTKVAVNDKNEVEVILKIPVKNHSIADIEQAITRNYVNYLESLKEQV